LLLVAGINFVERGAQAARVAAAAAAPADFKKDRLDITFNPFTSAIVLTLRDWLVCQSSLEEVNTLVQAATHAAVIWVIMGSGTTIPDDHDFG
jgi:hypothetical protein